MAVVRLVDSSGVDDIDLVGVSVVIVCDADPMAAARAARALTVRTAIFAGPADSPEAVEFARELELGLR